MSASVSSLLRNVWYFGTLSSSVKRLGMQAVEICGEPVVFFRDHTDEVAAIRNICPHRGIPLSYGRVVTDTVECPYHGWTFNKEGTCTSIPSLCSGQDLDCRKIKVKSYPVHESHGMIWIYLGEKGTDASKAPPIPALDFLPKDRGPRLTEIADFPCHLDHAVIGLMDPAHGPYVHKSWFWRNERSAYEKSKQFAPVPFGFKMVRHQPSKNSKAYKILGGAPTTEITFSLPCVRVEHIKVGSRNIVAFTALTPINDKVTRIHQMMYWDLPWLNLIKPLIGKFTKAFLYQDIDAVAKQQDGLRYDPSLMLIKDADQQAKWYFGLKDEWQKSQAEQREFQNPVKESVLRWRS